jgi:hypothetical protein
MTRSTAFAAWLRSLLSGGSTPDEPATTDAANTAPADIHDEHNIASWFLLPPV